MTSDPILAARFAEQIAGDFPDAELAVAGIVVRPVETTLPPRVLRLLWHVQGAPRHRGVILRVGSIWQGTDGRWAYDSWHFDGTYCPGVAAVELEQVDGITVVRAVCGWHLPDLFRVQRARSPWLIRLREIW